jgi:hypothetical protein
VITSSKKHRTERLNIMAHTTTAKAQTATETTLADLIFSLVFFAGISAFFGTALAASWGIVPILGFAGLMILQVVYILSIVLKLQPSTEA